MMRLQGESMIIIPVTIERATISDAEKLVEVLIASFHYDSVLYPEVELGGPPGYDSVEVQIKKMQEEYYKISVDGQIIGGIVVYIEGDGVYHLDLIFIAPDSQSKGIGTQAMDFLMKTYDAKKWTLDTPNWAVRNQHFYEKFGFVKVREHIEPDIILFTYEKVVIG